MSPLLTRFRKQRGERIDSGRTVVERHSVPLLYEPGSGWSYGTATDWVGRMVGRLTGQTLEQYMKQNIRSLLGITDATFWPDS